MILEELATRIEAISGIGLARPPSAPDNLFLFHLPESPDFAAVLLPGPGLTPDEIMWPPNAAIDRWRVAIWVRHRTPSVAFSTAQQIYLDVLSINNSTLSGTRWLSAQPLSPPFLLEVDKDRRTIIALNLQVKRESVA